MKTLEKFFDAGQEDKLTEQQQLYHENTVNSDERVAAVAGHEIEHATSEENHELTGAAREEEPNVIETEILRQTPGSRPLEIKAQPVKIIDEIK